jgi:hypothetical protein
VEDVLLFTLPIAALLSFTVVYGMERANRNWLEPLVVALSHPQGSFFKRLALKALGELLKGLSFVIRYVTHHLSVAASHSIAPVTAWVAGLAAWLTAWVSTAADFAGTTAFAIERLATHTIPHEAHKVRVELKHGIDELAHLEAVAQAKLRAYARGIDRIVTHDVLPKIRAAEHAIAVTLPRDIAGVRHRVGSLAHDFEHPKRAWLRRVATSMWALAFFGLLVKFLARRFPWLFCRKVKSVGNRLCSLDQDLLNSLIADTLLLSGTISVIAFAEELQSVEGEILRLIEGFIDELGVQPEDYLVDAETLVHELATVAEAGYRDYLA